MFDIKGIRTFATSAKDLDKAVEFYTKVIGGQIVKKVEPTEEQQRRPCERWRERHRNQKQARRQMREHHRIHQANPFREPRRAQMRKRIQYMNREKHQSQILLGNPKAPEEPVGHKRIGEESATKGIQRK